MREREKRDKNWLENANHLAAKREKFMMLAGNSGKWQLCPFLKSSKEQ